ncbi:hypothetical protein [Colwellia sp. 12G3]|uniref:hypothetical protein n=1 Tax=Colwellia sp. 12G3 TaxID=2058299 RepID=UPI000C34EFBF|nr:hypothetical protein [Colwellia sp. 12G3]PKI16577.1 hypothetical protein CXF71_08220 [Colwellia sp. 12G3]
MNSDKSESTDIEINSNSGFDSAIADFEMDYDSVMSLNSKKAIRKAVKDKYITRQKLDSIHEQRSLDRQLNSFSNYWDI